MIDSHLQSVFTRALETVAPDIQRPNIAFTHPDNPDHGDYATNIALTLTKQLRRSPVEIASQIAEQITPDQTIAHVEVVKPGFINIFLTQSFLVEQLQSISSGSYTVPPFHYGTHQSVMVEYAHPNTLKLFHIGHLRNITTGEAIARLLEKTGNRVIRANYQGDVGMHIAKTLWKLKQLDAEGQLESIRTADLTEQIRQIGIAYAQGNHAFETDEPAKQEIITINKQIYQKDPAIMPLWEESRSWSLAYFDTIYQMVSTSYDVFYFESQMAEEAVTLADHAQKKGILIEDQGAVIFPGEEYGLDRRVFLNSLGLPTYEGKELPLAKREFSEHGQLDRCIHVVTGEQTSFFKVTFKVQELLGLAPPGTQHHQVYGWVDVKGAKMSSRKGNVIEGAWLLDQAKQTILESYDQTEPETAQKLAVAAVKYAFLRHGLQNAINLDLSEAVTITGNSGPYLIYTAVRCGSILKKHAQELPPLDPNTISYDQVSPEELALLRSLYRFPEVIHNAAATTAPHLVATFLFETAQAFNLLYQKQPILKAEPAQQTIRLHLTAAVQTILTDGLEVLGIETVEKM